MFSLDIQIPPPTITDGDTAPPQVLVSEITRAVSQMANDRAPGKDGITVKMIKAAGYALWKGLAERFTMYLEVGQVPKAWKEAKTILIFKKGN